MSAVDQQLAVVFDRDQDADTQQELKELDMKFEKGQAFRLDSNYADAELLFKDVLAGYERIHGNSHPATLHCCNVYGLNLSDAGRHQEAEVLLRRAVDGQKTKLGPKSRQTIAAINNLALCLRAQGRSAEAAPLFRQALDDGTKAFAVGKGSRGGQHQNILITKNNLALCLQDQGQNEHAEHLMREVIGHFEAKFGSLVVESERVLYFYHNLASVLDAQRKDMEAELYYKRALNGMTTVLGEKHAATQLCIQNLVTMLEAIGRTAEANGYKMKLK
eukprot:gnl/TRDRNA2_/TRDRNA2_181529_c0_seq1.p1 gnl/TRDRNA2_/TRDRNA2_181529_c0~~gnl/TRDRNA2_/TRDRNA2_181529_c0_seq1.p1  ORF type:complete len:322 (+),score=73.62 gnl/TRDRNA2_/TRDRNA2_181529_c0_seq1:144-968(+)